MDWWLWLLVVVATLACLFLVVTFVWASAMLCKIARGDLGDLTDMSS
jgi:hypothetical protein